MNKYIKKISLFLALISLVSLPLVTHAHSGRTDKNGCHTEKATGNYHCHTTAPKEPKAVKAVSKTKSKQASKKVADMDCKDFSTQAQAQAIFLQYGGINNDIFDLDRDHDGIACETLK